MRNYDYNLSEKYKRITEQWKVHAYCQDINNIAQLCFSLDAIWFYACDFLNKCY